ncbi:37021_t:CDS:1, partial [Racocetra persica]
TSNYTLISKTNKNQILSTKNHKDDDNIIIIDLNNDNNTNTNNQTANSF